MDQLLFLGLIIFGLAIFGALAATVGADSRDAIGDDWARCEAG